MIPNNVRRVAAASSLVVLGSTAACSDRIVSPNGDAAPSLTATSTSTTSGGTGGTSSSSVTVRPTTNAIISVNGHTVTIPAGAICDPGTSGYGPTYWDKPCTPASRSITVQAKAWTDATGHPRVSFSPDVRFVPSKVVTLSLKDPNATASSTLRVNWCVTGSEYAQTCVDESKTDPSLATTFNSSTRTLTRRVKHFSGYMVTVGIIDESTDETQSGEIY